MQGRTQLHLLERDRELSELQAVVDAAIAGRGQPAVVEGGADAGKSALTAVASDNAATAGLRVLSARGSELERDFAFGAVRQLYEPALVTASTADRAGLLGGAAGPARWVVLSGGDTEVPSSRANASFAVLHALYWLTVNLALKDPLLIVVDDLHWVDASSLRFFSYLAGRIGDLPVALLVALRPVEPATPAALLDGVRASPGAVTMALGALSPAAVAELVRARIPDADDELCAACHAASAGNPLYLRELLRALTADGGVSASAVRAASVPSLADRVVRRVARVAPEAPALATAMAVLGDGGRLAVAAALAGLSESEAAGLAHELRRIEVLAAEDPFCFVHPLVRRSLYDQLSVTERDDAHAAAAGLLREVGAPAEAIAAHLGAVRPARSAAVATALMKTARRALARGAPDAAIRWFKRTLEEGAPEPPRAVVLAELGFAEVAARDMAAAGHLEAALQLAEDPALRARVSVALVEILVMAGRWEAGRAVAEAAISEFGEADPDIVVEVMAVWAATTYSDSRLVGEFDRGRKRFTDLATGDSWAAHALSAALAAAAATRGDRVADVVPLAERALRDGRLLAERGAGAWASAQVLLALVAIDEHECALGACAELVVQARACGSLTGLLAAVLSRGWVSAKRGELAAAEAELRTVLEMYDPASWASDLGTLLHLLQDAILERPSLDDVAALAETIELEPAFLATFGGAMLLEARGRLRLARGDRARATEDLRVAGATYGALRFGPTVSAGRSALALALPAEERAEASDLVAEELALARATGLARPHGVALRAAGILDGGEDGIERLRESASLLGGSEARLEHARSLVELGAALRRRGRRREARNELTSGMDLAYRCGAPRLVDRARDELHAAGARPRRIASTGVDALTASELRVARLAAESHSNTDIAQELYVSLKTVETHLSHTYSKLGLGGQGARDRLATALRSAAEEARDLRD